MRFLQNSALFFFKDGDKCIYYATACDTDSDLNNRLWGYGAHIPWGTPEVKAPKVSSEDNHCMSVNPKLVVSALKELYNHSDFYPVATELPEERISLTPQKEICNPARTIETFSLQESRKTEPEHLWKTLIPVSPVDTIVVTLKFFLDGVQRTTLLGEIPFRKGSPHKCALHFAQYACVVLKREARSLEPYKTKIRSLFELPTEFLRSKANEPKLASYLKQGHPRISDVEWVDTSFRSTRCAKDYDGPKVCIDGVEYPRIPDEELFGKCADPLWFRGHARHWTTRFRDRTEYHLSQQMAEEIGPAKKSNTEFQFVVKDGGIASVRRGLEKSILGVVKSFETKLLDDFEHVRVLSLIRGFRSPVFIFQVTADSLYPEEESESRGKLPSRISWYMRLHQFANRSPDFGLVRIEVNPAILPSQGVQDRWSQSDSLTVNAISFALLQERLPLSTPDPRWDKLIYPIKICERYLQSILLPQTTVKYFGQYFRPEVSHE